MRIELRRPVSEANRARTKVGDQGHPVHFDDGRSCSSIEEGKNRVITVRGEVLTLVRFQVRRQCGVERMDDRVAGDNFNDDPTL